MIAAESEQTVPQPGQAVEEQGPQEPETPQKTSVPDAVPQSPTNSEPIAEVKVTRRASQATDKAQKRARRLSVPGNLLSFLTGGSRRKSSFWGDNPPLQGSKDSEVSSAALGTVGTCPPDVKESKSTDKLKEQTSDLVDAPSNEAADIKDKGAKEETDKEVAQNSNHSSTPAKTELPADSSEKETLDHSQGSKDSEVSSAALGTVGTCPPDGKESESTDKPKEQTSDLVDAPSNEAADIKDKEAKEEIDKEVAQNSNHSSTPAKTELPADSSEKETLDHTKEDTEADEENVKSDDSGNNDQTFWKSLQTPAIINKDTAHPQSTPVIALCLETPLAKRTEKNEGNSKYEYLDLACPLKTCNSPPALDINKLLTVRMPSNNVPEEVPDLKKAQQITEPLENYAVEGRTEEDVEEPGELETDGGMVDTTKEESSENGKDINVVTEEHITANEDDITMKVECEDVNEAIKEEHVTTEIGHEEVNSSNEKSEEEESCEKDLCTETEGEEHSSIKEDVTVEVEHEDLDSRNENSENTRKSDEEVEIPTQDETTTDSQMAEIPCQNKEDTSSEGEKIIIGNERDAADDHDRASPTEVCSEKKEDETDSEEPEQKLQTDAKSVQNVTEEQSKFLGEDTTDVSGPKLKKQVMFAGQEDKNEQERPLANGLKNVELIPPHESNGSTPKESNEDIIAPLSPTEPPLSPGIEGVSLKQTTS